VKNMNHMFDNSKLEQTPPYWYQEF